MKFFKHIILLIAFSWIGTIHANENKCLVKANNMSSAPHYGNYAIDYGYGMFDMSKITSIVVSRDTIALSSGSERIRVKLTSSTVRDTYLEYEALFRKCNAKQN